MREIRNVARLRTEFGVHPNGARTSSGLSSLEVKKIILKKIFPFSSLKSRKYYSENITGRNSEN